jgi:UDP-N-acetylmuramyl tripeptide synthase
MFYLTLYLAKLTNFIINVFNLGAGYTWPGHIAFEIYPKILKHKRFEFPEGVILISGTNGKTTTSKLLTHVLEKGSLKVTNNRTGANLLNGIVSSVLLDMNLFGKHNSDIGVFEVDENNLPLVLEYLSPNVLVLLNLSRDQLDRFGEVDIILDKWLTSIKDMDSSTEIVLDATQKYFKGIPELFEGEVTYFDEDSTYLRKTSLVGKFNAKNVNATVFTSMLLGIDETDIATSLETFEYAYGRGEVVKYKEKEYRVLLAKNPASFNNNLEAIIDKDVEADTILVVFNDNIPDGRDVSWIYDIETEKLQEAFEGKNIYVTGTRYMDMAVRLKYAGLEVEEKKAFATLSSSLEAISKDSNAQNILCLPNYSAMLKLRKSLTGKAIL